MTLNPKALRDAANGPWEPAQWQKWRKGSLFFVTRKFIPQTGQWRVIGGSSRRMDRSYLVDPEFFDDAVFVRQCAEPIYEYAPETGTESGASSDPESTAGFTPPLPDSGDREQP